MADSSVKRFTVYDMLVEGARKQQSQIRLGQRSPPRLFTKPQKRKRGRPRKEIINLVNDGVAGNDVESHEELANSNQDRGEGRHAKQKRKYVQWSDEEVAKVLQKYAEFEREASRNHKRHLIMRRTPHFFHNPFHARDRAQGNKYKHLTRELIRSWLKGRKGGGNGRKQILSEGCMKAIDEKILELVDEKVHRVNSNALQPLLLEIIMEHGDGGKLGEGEGKLNFGPHWINRQCRRLNLRMRCTTKSTQNLPKDWEAQADRFILQLAHQVSIDNLKKEDVYNFDQTGVQFNPHAGGKTRAHKGVKNVETYNDNNKEQIS